MDSVAEERDVRKVFERKLDRSTSVWRPQPTPPLSDHPSTTSRLVQKYCQNIKCCCWRRFGKRASRRRRRRGRVFHEVSSVSEREPAPHQCRPDRRGKRRRLIMTPTWNDEERPLKGTTGYLPRTPSTQYNGQHTIPLLHQQPPSPHTIVRMCETHSRQQQPSIASATLCISPNFTFCLFVRASNVPILLGPAGNELPISLSNVVFKTCRRLHSNIEHWQQRTLKDLASEF